MGFEPNGSVWHCFASQAAPDSIFLFIGVLGSATAP